ncbi:tumor necrosis factor receptor superfamily member 10B-like isoform X4 [Pleurodeles waltl]|uniref:tumor necrosis factor receptor superfamily member 10B-like isoform X4 n=1 Tax=Pleurodeles waltl TaxID=8319 RepID=UPI0037096E33
MVCAHVQMRNRCSFYSGRSPLKKAQVSQGRFIPEHRHLSARSARGIRKDSLDYHDLASWGICPAGMHQEAPDENLGTRNMCTPCTDGKDYTEYQNSLRSCLSCTRCKEGQEEVSRCSPTRNTKCRCKAGTFCPPDQPCEVCVRCKTDCPEGEELISSCNATADNLCMRPTGPPATQGYVGWVVLIVIILFSICIVIVAYCLWKKRSQDSTGGSSSSTSKAGVSLVFPTLIPVDQTEQETLQTAFDVFIEEVAIKDWEYLMRKINLVENEIQAARCDYYGVKEQNYQMLLTWHKKMGHSVTVNTLLEAMRTGRLTKEADLIQDLLLKRNIYMVRPES